GNIEKLEWTEEVASPQEHYTELRLWRLHKAPIKKTVGKIKDHLASIYREFIRSGAVEIRFRGELLDFENPAILVAPLAGTAGDAIEWQKAIEFSLDQRHHVRGFAALRQVG